jgi:hypothetical protein
MKSSTVTDIDNEPLKKSVAIDQDSRDVGMKKLEELKKLDTRLDRDTILFSKSLYSKCSEDDLSTSVYQDIKQVADMLQTNMLLSEPSISPVCMVEYATRFRHGCYRRSEVLSHIGDTKPNKWTYTVEDKTDPKISRAIRIISIFLEKGIFEHFEVFIAICPGDLDACIYDYSPIGFLEHRIFAPSSDSKTSEDGVQTEALVGFILDELMRSEGRSGTSKLYEGRIFAFRIFRSTLDINSPTSWRISCPNAYIFFSN